MLAQLINIVDLHLVHLLLKYLKLGLCSARYFVEIHELQTELSVFEARGVANFGTRCRSNTPLPFMLAS